MAINISYKSLPTCAAFHASDAEFRGVMGPIGSGKSVAMCMEVFRRACQQAPNAEGIRKTRWAVIRNTYRELESTTLKTWVEWIPPTICTIRRSPLLDGVISLPLGDGTRVYAEVIFLALDKPGDSRKLLSLELTGVFVNEAREIDFQFIQDAFSRTARYPKKNEAPLTWYGLFMDTNPPNMRHWWYDMAENKKPSNWKFFRQPSALLKTFDEMGKVTFKPNPAAENVENQQLGYNYWHRYVESYDPEWVNIHVMGDYGSIFTGRAVYEDFWNDAYHVSPEVLEPYRGLPLILGWDFGLTPACVICQLSPKGQFRVLREFQGQSSGLRQFVEEVVRPALFNEYGGMELRSFGDPAGSQRSQVNEVTCLQELARLGIGTEAAVTNDFDPRREAVTTLLRKNIGGAPGFLLDPGCKDLRDGFNGGYQYSRLNVRSETGEKKYKEKPEKNMYSHLADALQYAAMSVDESFGRDSRPAELLPMRKGWAGYV